MINRTEAYLKSSLNFRELHRVERQIEKEAIKQAVESQNRGQGAVS
jgi:hypothetical protein